MTSAEKQLRLAVIEAFVKGLRPTQDNLADMVRRSGVSCSQRQVGIYFTKWSNTGICESQRAVNGRPGSAYIFNWSGRLPHTVTLREVAEPILTGRSGGDGGEGAMKLRSALRLALDVREYNTDAALLRECASIGAHEFCALAERAYQAALPTSTKRAAANYRAAIRALLRDAALANRIPIIFPKVWEDDAWAEARDRYFGSGVGKLPDRMRQFRTYWHHYSAAAKALSPQPNGPNEVTVEMVEEICVRFIRVAKRYLPSQVKGMLRWVARTYMEGPYAACVAEEGVTWTRNGWRNADRLLGPNGEAAADGNWETFLAIVAHNGYAQSWLDHLKWYGDFITLPEFQIEQQEECFPARPARWRLDPVTRVSRVLALRMLLYHAPRILGRPVAELTPYDVLGAGGRKLLAGLRERWAQRYEHGEVSSANSDTIEHIVVAVGLLAKSLALRVGHGIARGMPESVAGLGAVPLQQQLAAYEATYRSSGEQAKMIKKVRRREPSGHGDNSVRSVRRIIENTPARYWVQVLDESLRQVQSHLKRDGNGIRLEHDPQAGLSRNDFYSLVADTYYHGWLVSTGMRISETAHVRLDLQYSDELRAKREVHLRAIDRKETPNTLPHECMVRERYVPGWLEQLYLEQARPFFMQEWPLTIGPRKRQGTVQEHPWLFVDRKGRPVGCQEEDRNGEGRDKLRLRTRAGDLRKKWQAHCDRVALRLGLPISTNPRESSNHVIRIAMGFQIRQELGLTEAANYLGDQEGSIIGHYEGVSGKLVDHSILADQFTPFEPATVRRERQMRAVDVETPQPSAATGTAGLASARDRLDAMLDRLVAQFAAGEIEEAEFVERTRRIEGALVHY